MFVFGLTAESVCACCSDHLKAGNLLRHWGDVLPCTYAVLPPLTAPPPPLPGGSQVSSLLSSLLSAAVKKPTQETWRIQLWLLEICNGAGPGASCSAQMTRLRLMLYLRSARFQLGWKEVQEAEALNRLWFNIYWVRTRWGFYSSILLWRQQVNVKKSAPFIWEKSFPCVSLAVSRCGTMSWSGLRLTGRRSVSGTTDLRTCSCLLDRTWLFIGAGEMQQHTSIMILEHLHGASEFKTLWNLELKNVMFLYCRKLFWIYHQLSRTGSGWIHVLQTRDACSPSAGKTTCLRISQFELICSFKKVWVRVKSQLG